MRANNILYFTKKDTRSRQRLIQVFLILLLLALLTCGCAAPKVEQTDVPQAISTPTPAPTKMNQASSVRKQYEIQRGDTLWSISGQEKIYGDSFQWPILFKANRDTIKDPDLIYTGNFLTIERNLSRDERDQARKAASDTPAYKPHSQPRTQLPVDYF
jgi:hypothetical protein